MESKTCGDCRKFKNIRCGNCAENHPACSKFEQKVITNGDRIRQGGNAAIVEFVWSDPCLHCVYSSGKCKDKSCKDGQLAWLNAPAESEGKR